jgi:hypothetical protein
MKRDVTELDDLDRAEALLGMLDANQARLDKDIATVEGLRDGLKIGERARGGQNSSVDFLQYIEELERSDDADLRDVAARLRAGINDLNGREMTIPDILNAVDLIAQRDVFARLGVVDNATFEETVRQEIALHQRCGDSLAVFSLEVKDLTASEERQIAEAFAEMSQHPGDVLGRTERGFAFCIPWTEQAQAVQFERVFREIAKHVLPDHELAIGMRVGVPPANASLASFARPEVALLAPRETPALGGGRTR